MNQSNYPIAICALSMCPMRKKPEESSEMVSQLLFGEQCDVLDRHGKNWLLIRSRKDQYEGWVDSKMIQESAYAYPDLDQELYYCIETSQPVIAGEESRLVTFGAILPG